MRSRRLAWLCGLLLLAPARAQDEQDESERDTRAARLATRIQRHDRILELRWRRAANGDLEYAPQDSAVPFAPLFAGGVLRAAAVTGIAAPVAFLLHGGDVLSLTDGERHLARLGIATATADLAAFVRAPLPAEGARLAWLDRAVAIDVLRARGTADARTALAELTADDAVPAELRERARGAAPERRRLDAATLVLPAGADVFVVVDHARMPPASSWVRLGHLSSLVASAQVLCKLIRPSLSDYVRAESESEVITELPFEVARRFGNHRPDHTVLALTWPAAGGAFAPSVVVAGAFEPAVVPSGLPSLVGARATASHADGTTTFAWNGGSGTVTATRLELFAGSAPRARPELAARLLAPDDAALRGIAVEGSRVFTWLAEHGYAGIVEAEASLVLPGDEFVFAARLRAVDDAAATALAHTLRRTIASQGFVGSLVALLSVVDSDALRITAAGSDVTIEARGERIATNRGAMKQQLLRHLR